MKNKSLIIKIMLTVITIFIVIPVTYFFISEIDENYMGDNKLYGTIIETGSNYVKVKSTDENIYIIDTDDDLSNGDFIVAYFKKNDKNYTGENKIEVIAENADIEIETITSTYITSTTIEPTTTIAPNNTKTTFITSTSTKETSISDESIVSIIENDYVSVSSDDETLKEKAKAKFIEIVDFIFYDTEINGRTFDSLTTSAKAKVIYYALLLDNKIEEVLPNYKETIGSKYQDIKSMLIAEYMECVTGICSQDEEKCEVVKENLTILKDKLKLTWSNIYGAFKYAVSTSKEHLIEWYETFREN